MEDQGKRLLLAVALALGIYLVWQTVFPAPKPKEKPKTTDVAAETQKTAESPVGAPLEGAPPAATAVTPEAIAATRVERAYDRFVATFENGKLVSWRLTDPKYQRDPLKGEMVASRELGAFATNFYRSSIVLPKNALWTLDAAGTSGNRVTYVYDGPELKVTELFTLHPEDYLVELSVSVELKPTPAGAPREATEQLALSFVGKQDPAHPQGGGTGRTKRATVAACYLNGSLSELSAKRLQEKGPVERGGHVRWLGFKHPYLLFAVSPRGNNTENLACNAYPEIAVPGGMQLDLVYAPVKLKSGAPAMKKELVAYIGPKHLEALEQADEIAGYETGFQDAVHLGWFAVIGRPLLWLLTWFYSFVGNWGIAIILLTVLVKLATLYWTTKSMRSMKRMAALKPKMDELQKKYGEDRAKLQQETMGLYKANGVNPLTGCLPILLQMPIWLALYKMLSSAGELYLAPFVPGWITDLTSADPYYVLPVMVTGMMFLSTKLNPTSVDSAQQKILIYGMPLIFGVMSFFFPAGLSIYIFTNSTLSLLHTLYMKRFDHSMPLPAKPAAAKTAAPAPIDVEAVEKDADDEDEGDEDGADDKPATPARGPQQPGNRRSNASRRKRKRGKH